MKRLLAVLAPLAALTILVRPAVAHHAMAGAIPTAFDTGLLSGLAHPVINFDHFAFIVAVGVLTAVAQGSWLLPIWFVGGTVAGCLFAVNLMQLPLTEWFVPASVAVLGVAMALG